MTRERIARASALLLLAMLAGACSDREGMTPLMRAAKEGRVTALNRLIDAQSDLNAVSQYGWTALMFAAREGHEPVVVRLLEAGANPNIESQRIAIATTAPYPQSTALREAIDNGHAAIAHLLVDAGAAVDPAAVALAGALDDGTLLERFHEMGIDFNEPSEIGYHPSALIVASRESDLARVKWLIDRGAEPNLIAGGSSALLGAAYDDRAEIVRYLLERGAQPDLVIGRSQVTALLRAATKHTNPANAERNLEVIRILLAHGADPDYRSNTPYYKGKTAIEYLAGERPRTLERIRQNPYGEGQQRAEIKLLEHRDAIMALLHEAT